MTLRTTLLAAAVSLALVSHAPAATFIVVTLNDLPDTNPGDGLCNNSDFSCSLRAAIQEANATPALDTIAFVISASGPLTIRPTHPLPPVTQPVFIDGYTQPGTQPNTLPAGLGTDAVLRIELDLSASGPLIVDGGDSIVRGLVLTRGSIGVWIRGGLGTIVEGCFIGTDPSGASPRGNGIGIRVDTSVNLVGGHDPSRRNLISGNGIGIFLPCPGGGTCYAGLDIVGNLIGTDATMNVALPNGTGIIGSGTSSGLRIGGPTPEAMNVIGGNTGDAIVLTGSGAAHRPVIQGNLVGVATRGQVPVTIPNGGRGIWLQTVCPAPPCASPTYVVRSNNISLNSDGVVIDGGAEVTIDVNGISGNRGNGVIIASSAAPVTGVVAGNTIAVNGHGAIAIQGGSLSVTDNLVFDNGPGTGAPGIAVTGASDSVVLARNQVFRNGGLGIDLRGDGVTANDPGDADSGPNSLQNLPAVTSACWDGSSTTIQGTLSSLPNSAFTIELFAAAACDPSGHGEGDVVIVAGPASVVTDAAGNAAFQVVDFQGWNTIWSITATASSPSGTSEFSQCVRVFPSTPPAQVVNGPAAVCEGTPFTLSGVAGASAYQWFRDGVPIAGATGLTYPVASATPADAGSYTVRASSCGADAMSAPHALSIVTCLAFPLRLEVDRHAGAGTSSDLNGVFERFETVLIEPRYRHDGTTTITLSGTATLTGPPPAGYGLFDATADYGTVAPGQVTDCFAATGDCYIGAASGQRPQAHWDATFTETTDGGDPPRRWPVHLGETFDDVPRTNSFYRFVEALAHNNVTAGCSAADYCPLTRTTREQMAVFVLVAREGAGYAPPACDPGAPRFTDVPASSGFCRFIEELARRGVVIGCSPTQYCPAATVARDQMAVFVLATREAAGYQPPPCVAGSEIFADVPASSGFCPWVEELARRNVVAGCGNGNYCPTAAVTRGEMSVFIVATFGLLLYGP